MVYLEIAIVVVLICLNGLLAMSELAIVSARPARLKAMIDREVKGAGRALALGANPGRFLSTVQIGITLVGVLSGAFSGATLGHRLSETLMAMGMPAGFANPLGVGVVVAAITYGSLIIGELVPKQIALRDPEGIAVMVAPAMTILSKVALAARLPARLLRPRCSVAARPARRVRGEGHRRGDQDAGRRGRASWHDRIRRAPHDRRRDAARRPGCARRHDAAHRDRLAEPRMGRADRQEVADGDAAFPASGRRRRGRQHDRRRADPRPPRRHARRPGFRPAQARAPSSHRARSGRRARRVDDAEGKPKCRWRWSTTNTAISKAS